MSSSNPDIDVVFTEQGPRLPTSNDVLSGVIERWQIAFDNLLNDNPATPQGQLMATTAALLQDKNAQLARLASQFDPATASGRFQDALAAIYFIQRQPARPTEVNVTCTGLSGTVIAGIDQSDTPALVADVNGNQFYCRQTGTIPGSGSITLPFVAAVPGPTIVAAHAITKIVEAQPGWDSVDNETAGVTGRATESRGEFEARRRQSVALNSRSMLASIHAEVAQLEGVLDVLSRQNRGDTPLTERGVTMGPHSVYIAVVGGSDNDIAKALYNTISGGCDYNGNTSVEYRDPVTGARETVKFERPSPLALKVSVSIRVTPDTPNDIESRVRENIIADFNGQPYANTSGTMHNPDVTAVGIGATLYASRFVCPVVSAGADNVSSITIAAGSGGYGSLIELDYDQYLTLSPSDIIVVAVGA